jgi:hypothetical protein
MKAPLALFAALLSLRLFAQTPAEWQDGLVSHLAGSWKLEGKVTSSNAHHDVQVDWVLDRQFLRIQEKTSANAPAAERRYDSIWYLGYDPISERYVLHLMDTFGARFSETIGYGTREGDQIKFVFEYPDGPFHNTYSWNVAENTWRWQMEQKTKTANGLPSPT